MSITGESHWLALRVGQAGQPDWLSRVADRVAFRLGVDTNAPRTIREATHGTGGSPPGLYVRPLTVLAVAAPDYT